jgi:hypothetical protein
MSNGWLEKGAGILRSASAGWKNFGVVTTRSPWHLERFMF